MENINLKNKIALVTGGSGKIGAAIVSGLARAGADVTFVYRKNKEAADALAAETGATALRCDIRSKEEADKMLSGILDSKSKVDILVNNAGEMSASEWGRGGFEDTWKEMLDINLTAHARIINRLLPEMKSNAYGRIVNIGSLLSGMSAPYTAAFQAAKAGMEAVTRSVAVDFAKFGIRSNMVVPGMIDSSFRSGIAGMIKKKHGLDLENELVKKIPAGRFGRAGEAAKAVLFLVSDESDYVNGERLVIDGGLSASFRC
jgi:NAD(P)-dependent dehydrogenase (short-subunit alcohol dehydrogenase family)